MPLDLLKRAINKYGEGNQIIVAIEELSELQKELCKTLRGEDNYPHVVEELADVYIMLDYIKILYSIDGKELNDEINIKLNRLEARVDGKELDE